ncbi:MAG: hypothetical protein HY051_06400 [Candidatus Aenigmarchaeota archaeon]|nr:hypothetical protein [Candidatus Aenigmarchaeota archaeon]
MKGIIITRDFMIFLGELGILLLSILFIVNAGAAMGEFVFNFDSRLASETLFGFHAAADMAPKFEASFVMPPNPYKIKIAEENGNNYVLIESTREIFRLADKATVKTQPARKLFLIHYPGNKIIPTDVKMDEKRNWLIEVKKINTDISTITSKVGGG